MNIDYDKWTTSFWGVMHRKDVTRPYQITINLFDKDQWEPVVVEDRGYITLFSTEQLSSWAGRKEEYGTLTELLELADVWAIPYAK